MTRPTTAHRSTLGRGRFLRSRDERVLTGVAGGIGARIGVDPVVVRIVFVILTLAGGAGLLLYAVGWWASDEPDDDTVVGVRPFDVQQAVALGLIALGTMLALRSLGVWISDALVLPALLLGTASAVVWTRGDVRAHAGEDPAGDAVRHRGWRAGIGAVLAMGGLVVLLSQTVNPLPVIAPLLGLGVGLLLLVGPWLLRLSDQLGRERLERARAEAREDVAAHLHDSVLQTLALIQRSGDDPRRAAQLARRQERELRSWLYGDAAPDGRRLLAAVTAMVDEVEAGWPLDVDVVVVGDVEVAVDPAVEALVAALHEALRNVAKHADVPTASLYVEVRDDDVQAFVRDRGRGFDPDAVPVDRRGIRDSLVGRLRRHGGRVTLTSGPDGTEIELEVPLTRQPDQSRTPS